MKTDETIKFNLKQERRKLFDRLYTLPWLLLFLILLLLVSIVFVIMFKLYQDNLQFKLKSIELQLHISEMNDFSDNIKGYISQPEFKREYPFDKIDYEMSKKLDINLEENLITEINWAIDETLTDLLHSQKTSTECVNLSGTNMMLLKRNIKQVIRKEFDGFETYHKLNK